MSRKISRVEITTSVELPLTYVGKITQQQLEKHLWDAADILRGKIDSADFKHYIFGLLFFKRLCDVWEEEYEERLKLYQDAELAADPEEHRFHIPPGAFWHDIRKHSTNIGENLNAAFRAIEDANTRLRGVFQDVDFNNKERFPDATLELLLQHFSKHRLRNCDVEADILGDAYEYLISQFADDAGKKGGEFYTPKMVTRLIVMCLQPDEGMSIYDPTCGSGGMLLEAVNYLKRQGKNPNSLQLYGQEMNLNTWAICEMNLFLHDIDDAFILRGDTLREPKHLETSPPTPLLGKERGEEKQGKGVLKKFDRVLANPPFSLKNWGDEAWKNGDKFSRDTYGCPPKSYGDLAFVQHMIASLNETGKLGVVLPHGILFRGGAEAKIRQGILQDDLIEAVIGLAPNLFYGTGIPACVLIINKQKEAKRRSKVLFVNGAEEMVEGKNQNTLSEANVERLVKAFLAFADAERFARVVDLAEIEKNDFNLNIARYVQTAEEEEQIDVAAEVQVLKELLAKRDKAEAKMLGFLKELGYE
ncbi:type I restriction-modification system M subunit [Calothrix brevissima NIES-22]|nr:type I restriction-modification system M subunit [Calothrix brevissima NIES-22]